MTKTNRSYSNTNAKKITPWYKRWWFITLLVIILISAIIALLVLFCYPHQDASRPSSSPDTPYQTTPSQSDTTSPNNQNVSEPANKVPQYEAENPNQLQELTGLIAYKGVNGKILAISVVIDQFIQNEDGLCILKLHSLDSDYGYTASSDIVPEMSTSICETFEVDISAFPAGKYSIDIELVSSNKKGNIHDEVEL